MCAKALKGTSLARSVPKPLKAPSLARSVPKPLKVPSLARSVPKPFKLGQRGRGGRQAALFFVPRDSLTLRCRPLTQLVVGSVGTECTTPPSQLRNEMKWWWWNDDDEMMMMMTFWVFDFYETFICYRGVLKLNFYIGKKVQKKFLMGLKIWWSWGSVIFFSKLPQVGRFLDFRPKL